jgi:hypothetical protein
VGAGGNLVKGTRETDMKKFKTKQYWELDRGEPFRDTDHTPYLRLDSGSVCLDHFVDKGKVFYFEADAEVYELFSRSVDVRGYAVVNEFGEIVGEGEID